MPKITVMSAEKAFLSAHYGGPFKQTITRSLDNLDTLIKIAILP